MKSPHSSAPFSAEPFQSQISEASPTPRTVRSSAGRRQFFQFAGLALGAAWGFAPEQAEARSGRRASARQPEAFKISLAQWSLHKELQAGRLDPLDFAKVANSFGINAIEYVNRFYSDKIGDRNYLAEMKRRAADHGVWSLLIMVDDEGDLGVADAGERRRVVDNHKKWLEAAAYLGCHSIRVNARSEGTEDEQTGRVSDGLRRLAEVADVHGLNVLVENHGGLSSNAQWLSEVMTAVGHPRCGTLPDFGNFNIDATHQYDRYKGVRELMPFARAVSAKTYNFDAKGNETTIHYPQMMKIVTDAGYHGYVGIEYEGKKLSEYAGIERTKRLLERSRATLSSRAKSLGKHG